MSKYTLVGVDGNAFSVMGYTAKALKREGLSNFVNEMYDKAMSGDYNHLLSTCLDYVELANEEAEKHGYVDEDDE